MFFCPRGLFSIERGKLLWPRYKSLAQSFFGSLRIFSTCKGLSLAQKHWPLGFRSLIGRHLLYVKKRLPPFSRNILYGRGLLWPIYKTVAQSFFGSPRIFSTGKGVFLGQKYWPLGCMVIDWVPFAVCQKIKLLLFPRNFLSWGRIHLIEI